MLELGPEAPDWVVLGDNAGVLPHLPSGWFQLIYIDPPFNTGKSQLRLTLRTNSSEGGDRRGFAGRTYSTEVAGERSYADRFDDYLGFLAPRLSEARRLLRADGTLYFHIDYREAHYCKVLLDEIFGRECFLNEVIWAYDYGGRPKRRWPPKHDTILVYVRDPARYYFDQDAVERIPYMAPSLVTKEKAARGKAHRCLVAHDRADQWPGEDRLPQPEARGGRAPRPAGILSAGGLGARLLRRQRHHGRGRPPAGPALRARGRQP